MWMKMFPCLGSVIHSFSLDCLSYSHLRRPRIREAFWFHAFIHSFLFTLILLAHKHMYIYTNVQFIYTVWTIIHIIKWVWGVATDCWSIQASHPSSPILLHHWNGAQCCYNSLVQQCMWSMYNMDLFTTFIYTFISHSCNHACKCE